MLFAFGVLVFIHCDVLWLTPYKDKLISIYILYYTILYHGLAWQLIGCSPNQRNQYIRTLVSPSKVNSCHIFLKRNPELNLLSLVPVNISLMAGLVDRQAILADMHTLTDTYTSFVMFTLDKGLKRIDPNTSSILSISHLPADMLSVFQSAKLSYMDSSQLLFRRLNFLKSKHWAINTQKASAYSTLLE